MNGEISFADLELARTRKVTRVSQKLDKINTIVEWDKVLALISVTDKTSPELGGRPPHDLLVKIKMLYLQYLYNLSDPELEEQVNDRISFQRFAGIDCSMVVPDYTTLWRFKEALIKEKVMDSLFALIISFLEAKGLLIKKGKSVDATIIESTTRVLSKKRREELEENPSSQIDTDAESTEKRGKKFFGYKGHIGTDMGSGLIRKRDFTSARPHDSQSKDKLWDQDDKARFGDSAYSKKADKQKARKDGIYYGILDKATKKRKLSTKQRKRNKKNSAIRCKVEHPFGYMKTKLNYRHTVAKTLQRNSLQFDFNCMLYNIFRANYLLQRVG